ncbi:MAG: AAA family ATPase [Wenzhouxiangellaceae bacterium]
MHKKLISALQKPEAYSHAVDEVELIETHISWVLLAGDFVYKIKKPLDLGFLDFSTLEKRRFFCAEEIRLNKRTAPELYLEAITIGGTPEQPVLEAEGEAIEYAVKMRRFDTRAGFDHLLADGRLEHAHITGLGRRLAELHRIAEVAPPDSRFGSFDDVAGPMRDNFDDLGRMLNSETASKRLDDLNRWTERQLEHLTPLLEKRQGDGFTRECHGDAHLGNVALVDGRATLFDCIEFSEDLRWIDVICDLAFTVMDLRDRGAPGYAWLLLDEYLAHSGDYEGVQLLPIYMVYRALVRAKVNAYRLDDDDADRREVLTQIDGYLELAEALSREYLPAVLITMGVSGSGKSWLARRLVERVGLVRMRSDVERKRLHGLDPQAASDSGLETELYSNEATEHTYRHLAELARPLIAAGIPVMIDAACLKQWQRVVFRELAEALDATFAIIQCHAAEDVLRDRIRGREQAGDDPSEAGLEVLAHQQRTLEPLDKEERGFTLRLDTAAADSTEHAAGWIRQRLDIQRTSE